MSAALQLPLLWAARTGSAALQPQLLASAAQHIQKPLPEPETQPAAEADLESPETQAVNYAFYRRHTEKLLRRYLYASMQVGRSPNILGESIGQGWVSSRRIRTFEDALIFVLDIERCIQRLDPMDQRLISRLILQEYTHSEAADLLRISVRTVRVKLPQAIDRLTEILVEADLLVLPE